MNNYIMEIFISILGLVFTLTAIYTDDMQWMFLGISPLMASLPILMIFGRFLEWAESKKDK